MGDERVLRTSWAKSDNISHVTLPRVVDANHFPPKVIQSERDVATQRN